MPDPNLPIYPLRLRSTNERIVEGVIVPYGEELPLAGNTSERFEAGVFADVDPSTVRFAYEHAEVIGRMVELNEEPAGAVAAFEVAPTSRGDDVLILAERGLVGLSVGFRPVETRTEGRTTVITRADLREVSAVGFPAYSGAQVTATRTQPNPDPESPSRRPTVPEHDNTEAVELEEPAAVLTAPSALVDEIVERAAAVAVDEVRSLVVAPTPAPAAPAVDFRELFTRALTDVANPDNGYRTRALADVIGDLGAADASGLLPQAYIPELIGYVNAMRPFIANSGTLPWPTAGYGLTFPRRTQTTLVGPRGAEKSEIPTRAVQVEQSTFPMEWFAGGVDVALELIWQSNPAALTVVVEDLLEQYAGATETAAVNNAEANGASVGTPLPTDDYATFIAALVAQSATIKQRTGIPGNLLALPTDDWAAVLGLVDSDNRRVLATNGASNADGSALLTAEAVNIGGVVCFHSHLSTVPVQYNSKAFRVAERPPATVSVDNPALMGRDIGVIGGMIPAALYTEGVQVYTAAP